MANPALSKAQAAWDGDLFKGKGTFSLDSGVLKNQDVSWAGRAERLPGTTSPEELIAAAHATCYAMAFSNTLAQRGTPPTHLDVSATCTFVPGEGIKSVDLQVRGTVQGIDQAGFEEAAREGEKGCPVSNALRNNVQISVTATLES